VALRVFDLVMVQASASYDCESYGGVHDVQYDYLGRRLATATGDALVRIWSVEKHEVIGELRGHRAPAICLSWGQSRYASTLASASDDGHVIIWREKAGTWQIIHQLNVTGCVSELALCPPEYGLMLAIGGFEEVGVLTIVTAKEIMASPVQPAGEQWLVKALPAHNGGIVGLSWAPSSSAATLATGPAVSRAATHAPRRLATAGVDGAICIWHLDPKTQSWTRQHSLQDEQIKGAIRGVAWRPNPGIPSSLLMSCTDDGNISSWVQDMEGQPWQLKTSWRVPGDARRLTWSRGGTLLAVSVGDEASFLFKEGAKGEWQQICDEF